MTDVAMIAPPDDGTDGIGTYTGDLLEAFDAIDATHVTFPPTSADPREYVRTARRATRSGADLIHVQHEYALFGPVSALGWLFFPLLFVLARLRDQRIVLTLHTAWNSETVAGESLPRLKYGYVQATNRLLVAVADRLVFLSDNCRESFFESVSAQHVETIPHGVKTGSVREMDQEEAKRRFGYDAGETVVVEPGYVREQKGTHRFVAAAEHRPDWQFLVAGGPQDDSVHSYVRSVREMAPDNVRITGRLDDEQFHAAFVAADVICLPYLRMTQSGVFNWAVAYGTPVVAANHEYFRQLRADYECVELFDPDDETAIVEAIERVVESPRIRERLRRGLADVRDEQSFDSVARKHRQLYDALDRR